MQRKHWITSLRRMGRITVYKSLAYLEASKQNSLAVDLRNYSKFGEYYKKADELYQKESASNANDADMERLQELYQQAVDNGWL